MNSNDPLMTEYNLNYSQRSSPHGAVNTLTQLQQDRQCTCTYNVTRNALVEPLLCRKAVHFTYSACVSVALVSNTQCACAISSFVACPGVQYISTLSHKRHDFGKKKLLDIKCVF